MQSDLNEQAIDDAVETALLRKDVELLAEKVDKLSSDVEELVAAWKTANYVVVFVKWLSGAAVAVLTVYSILKSYWVR